MNAKSRIKIITILLCIFNISALAFIDYSKNIRSQLVLYLLFVILGFIIFFYFYKGKNWARIVIIIGAVLNLLSFLGSLFIFRGILRLFILICETAFSLYLIIILNKETMKTYFVKGDASSPKIRSKSSLIKKITLVISTVVIIFIAALFLLVRSFESTLENCEIWIEDIDSGKSERVTDSGGNIQPAFSKDGDKIVFIHRVKSPKKKNVSEMDILSLKDNMTITVLSDGKYNYSPSWGPDPDYIYYLSRQEGASDIWKLRVSDRQKTQVSNDGLDKGRLSVSPDGRWLIYLKKEKRGGLDDIYIMPSVGGKEKRLTTTVNFLEMPKEPAWSPDSQAIIYISFVSLVILDIDGKIMERLDLTGLNNISEPFFDTKDADKIFFKARPAESVSFDCYLYAISRKIREINKVRNSSLAETGYKISPSGGRLVYTRPYKRP